MSANMNRSRRTAAPKQFVSGGVFNAAQNGQQQQQQPNRGRQSQTMAQQPDQQKIAQQQQQDQSVKQPQNVQQQELLKSVKHPYPVPQIEVKQEKVEDPVPASQPQDVDESADQPMLDTEEASSSIVLNQNGKLSFKRIFLTRKKSSVRAKEKRVRQNRQLRKAILPKNALMALNEVKGLTISDFVIDTSPGGGFTALVTVNNIQFEGRGSSKMAAKNNACEKALRDYVISKMRTHGRKAQPQVNTTEAMDAANDSDGGESQKNTTSEEDDLPMINLASFALFKLFTDWEKEGFTIPDLHPSAVNTGSANDVNSVTDGNAGPKKPLPIRSELPLHWENMHPTTLLCMMRPGISYTDLGTVGEKPTVMQRMGVIIDGEQFVAMARSKKLARRNAAVAVCNKLFGTNFNQDEAEPMEAAL